jgi:hypothetical protein
MHARGEGAWFVLYWLAGVASVGALALLVRVWLS